MKSNTLKLGLAVLAATAALLAACGDSSSASSDENGNSSASNKPVEHATLDDAGACAPSRYGETIFVTSESELYFCSGKKWVLLDDGEDDGTSSVASGTGNGSSSGATSAESDVVSSSSLDESANSSGSDPASLSNNEEGNGSSSSADTAGTSSEELVSSSSSLELQNVDVFCGAVVYDTTTHFCDIRDSSVYRMVRIGSLTWMAENLNYEYKINGVSYGSYCYGARADSCAKYGRLYTWAAAMDSATTGCGNGKECAADTGSVQGVCPAGWHLPSYYGQTHMSSNLWYGEWDDLFAAVGGQPTAGAALKTSSGWADNGNGSDAYGFSALPSGYGNGGRYWAAGAFAYFWSSSEASAGTAYHMHLPNTSARAYLVDDVKSDRYAVRCVKE